MHGIVGGPRGVTQLQLVAAELHRLADPTMKLTVMHHLHHWSGTKLHRWHKKIEMIRDAFCICHEATHCQQLSNLRDVTSSTAGRHHVDLKKSTALLLAVSLVQNHSLLSFSGMRCLSKALILGSFRKHSENFKLTVSSTHLLILLLVGLHVTSI